MGHVEFFLTSGILILLLSHQACSISNQVTYISESHSATDVDQLNFSRRKNIPETQADRSQPSKSYCNDHTNIHGQEGAVKPGFTLRQVHIILTPGQSKLPVETAYQSLHIPEPPCQIVPRSEDSPKILSFEESSRIYSTVQDEKHGFKYFHPILSKTCAGNHLTSTGFKQSISVGEHLSKSYFNSDHNKLKPQNNDIIAESISEKLSYHSLLAFLHGFLPEKLFANTKVHKTSGHFCSFHKESHFSCHCRTANYLHESFQQSLIRGTYLYKDGYPSEDKIKAIFSKLSILDLSPVDLYQTLMHHICDNIYVVCDKNYNCLNITDQDHIQPLRLEVSSFFWTVFPDPTFQQFSQLYTFPFLHKVVTKADRYHKIEKIHIYSGDRVFLYVLMSSLGIRMEKPILIATRLVVEVYQKNRGQFNEGLLYFNIIFNGQDITDQLPFCDGELEEGLCNLQNLKDKVTQLQNIYQDKC